MESRVDVQTVRAAWRAIPVMLAEVVAGIGIRAAALDQSAPATAQPYTATDLRLDEAQLLRAGARHWAWVWAEVLRKTGDESVLDIGREVRVFVDEWHEAAIELVPLVRLVDDEWDELARFGELWEDFLHHAERWLLPSWREWSRSGQATPKRCRRCGVAAVRWDVTISAVRCSVCGHEYGGQLWLSIPEAAVQLGVTERSIQRWVSTAGTLVQVSGDGADRRVEVNSCRAEMQARDARKKLGKKQ